MASRWPISTNTSNVPLFSSLQQLRYVDLNIASKQPLGIFNPRWQTYLFSAKVLIAVTSHCMAGWRPPFATFLMASFYLWILVTEVWLLPRHGLIFQAIYSAWAMMCAYAAALLFAKEARGDAVSSKTASTALAKG